MEGGSPATPPPRFRKNPEQTPPWLLKVRGESTFMIFKNLRDLQPAIRHAPVPDVIYNDLATVVQYLVYYPVIPDTDPVQIFGAGKLVGIVGDRIGCQVFNVLKNVRDNFSGNFPEILFSAFLEGDAIRIHGRGSHHAFLQLGKADRALVPPLGNHGEIVEIFPEVLVFPDGEDHGDLVAVLIYNILFGSCHTKS